MQTCIHNKSWFLPLHLSVILFTAEGCVSQHALGQTRPWADTRPPTPADGYCSRRYASYWNAFLCLNDFRCYIFTARKRSNVLHPSVSHCVTGGGVSASGSRGVSASGSRGVYTPWTHTPLETHPPGRDGHWSGRYASYWDAFLLYINLLIDCRLTFYFAQFTVEYCRHVLPYVLQLEIWLLHSIFEHSMLQMFKRVFMWQRSSYRNPVSTCI